METFCVCQRVSHKVAKGPILEPNSQLQVLPLLLTGWVTVGKPGNSSMPVCPVGIIVALHPILKYNDPTHTVLLPAFFRLIKRVNGFHVIKYPSIKCLRATRHPITRLCHKAFWSLQARHFNHRQSFCYSNKAFTQGDQERLGGRCPKSQWRQHYIHQDQATSLGDGCCASWPPKIP